LADTLALAGLAAANYRIAISPDGERLVYVGMSPDGSTRLWMRTRDQLSATPLAGTEGAVNPFFSPDGSRVGFETAVSSPAIGDALKVVRLDGGPPTVVTDSGAGGGAAWGHDGYIYFNARWNGHSIVARVPEAGGVPQPVTMPDSAKGEWWLHQPEPLPNGKGVLFGVARNVPVSQYDIAVVDLATGTRRALVRGVAPRYAASGHLVYATAAGTLMAAPFDQDRLALAGSAVALAEGVGVGGGGVADLAISATGTMVYVASPSGPERGELVWVTREGKATPVDTTWRGEFWSLALSPDGAELAAAVMEGDVTNVWIKRLDHGPARKLTFEGSINEAPAWTPEGRAVAYTSNSRSRSKLVGAVHLARADGSAPPEVLRDNAGRFPVEVEYSHDTQWLVYGASLDLFAVRTGGDTAPIPLVATPFEEFTPRLSPDGRWLAYASNESGRREVYVRPFPATGTTKWQVSPDGGDEPLWSRSGQELFYKHRGELLAAAVLPGATFALGKQQVLFSIAGYENYVGSRMYDVTPDGRRFVMVRSAARPRAELIVVENVFEELKAKVRR
jgi:serine/threonine-protein kinase